MIVQGLIQTSPLMPASAHKASSWAALCDSSSTLAIQLLGSGIGELILIGSSAVKLADGRKPSLSSVQSWRFSVDRSVHL
jgi:hypothetical protein